MNIFVGFQTLTLNFTPPSPSPRRKTTAKYYQNFATMLYPKIKFKCTTSFSCCMSKKFTSYQLSSFTSRRFALQPAYCVTKRERRDGWPPF
jgi:hypothetical protein